MKKVLAILTLIVLYSLSVEAQDYYESFEQPPSVWMPAIVSNTSFYGTKINTVDSDNITTISQSSQYVKSGSYSMKVTTKMAGATQRLSVVFPYVNPDPPTAQASFGMNAWIYIPSNENPGITSFSDKITAWSVSGGYGRSRCSFSFYQQEMKLDEWFQMNPVLERNISLWIAQNSTSTLVYYVDEVQTKLRTFISYDANFVNNGIAILPPSGGVSYFQGTIPTQTYNLGYRYEWNDDNTITSSTRVNLQPGTIYTVKVTQPMWTANCSITKYHSYSPYPANPPGITNGNICNVGMINKTICEGESLILTACGASQAYHKYSWYSTDTGGSPISNEATLNTGVLNTPGLYKYYVQIDIDGNIIVNGATMNIKGPSSSRTEIIITVNAKPKSEFIQPSAFGYRSKPIQITDSKYEAGYSYAYNFKDGTAIQTINSATISHVFQNSGIYNVNCKVSSNNCFKDFTIPVEVKNYVPFCEAVVPASNASFRLDKSSGQVEVSPDNCRPAIVFGCITGKVESVNVNKVVSASATTYSDNWNSWNPLILNLNDWGFNKYEKGVAGKYRMQASYTYNNSAVKSDRNLNSGTFALSYFNWQNPVVMNRVGWIKTSEATRYSQHGELIEEKNALDIYSVAKYGYGGGIPYLIAKNCTYTEVMFESFENTNIGGGSLAEERISLNGNLRSSQKSHSGINSLALTNDFHSREFTTNGKPTKIRFWLSGNLSSLNLTTTLGTISTPIQIARSGEWALYESTVSGYTSGYLFKISFKPNGSNIYIDDVRVQPADAEMTCYVYDPSTFRLLAVLDDQHFGLFYQYNEEGKLVRKMIETSEGVKTIQETQYNTPAKLK